MARRDLRQVSFADGLVNQRAGRNSWMDEIDKLIDWSAVVKVLDGIYGSDEGRPSYPLLTYVKLLLLQQWYGLSDPGLEEAVDDRLSLCRSAVGRERSRPFDDLALPPGVGGARAGRGAVRGDQPPARCPRADCPPGHADRRDTASGLGQAAVGERRHGQRARRRGRLDEEERQEPLRL